MYVAQNMNVCGYCGAEAKELAFPDQTRPWKKMLIQHAEGCLSVRDDEYIDVLVRPSWEEIFMQFAHELSKRSSCSRLQVGCVVVSSDNQRILAMGYNGDHQGGSNKCDSAAPGACGCIHGEMNALIKMNTNDPIRKIMFLTDSPCKMCAKLIVNAGIDKVIYERDYRLDEGLKLLRSAGVDVSQFAMK